MPYIKKGAEIYNPDTGFAGLARRACPVTVVEEHCDDEACQYLVRIKRRVVMVDASDLELTGEEYAALMQDEERDDLPPEGEWPF